MKKVRPTKKTSVKKSKKKPASTSAKQIAAKKPGPGKARRKTSERVRSAASHLRKTTKKMVDDVFLKIVGMKVLARAHEITQNIKKEKSSKKRAQG